MGTEPESGFNTNIVLALCADASGQESLIDGTGDGWVRTSEEYETFIEELIDGGLLERGGPQGAYVRPTEQGRQAAAQWRPQ